MDIKKFGCRKSFKKPTILWFLEWERENKTETRKSRRNEWWQSVGIIPGKVKGKNLKWGGCTICMQPIPCNCICLPITIQKAAYNWAAQTRAHLSLQNWDGGHKSATPNTACPFGCSFPNPPFAPSSLLCWRWPLTQKPVPAARPETTYSSPLLSPHSGGPLVGTFGGTGRASCRKLVRKAAWTPGEPGLQSWQEHRGSQQKEIFLSAHLVQRATHFVFVLKLGSKHSHPKEKYKGILKLQEPISSDKIKFQTSDKLMHEKKKTKTNPLSESFTLFRCYSSVSQT